jgi:hypothetical protein
MLKFLKIGLLVGLVVHAARKLAPAFVLYFLSRNDSVPRR